MEVEEGEGGGGGGGREGEVEECSSSAHSNTVHSSRQTAEKKVTIKQSLRCLHDGTSTGFFSFDSVWFLSHAA